MRSGGAASDPMDGHVMVTFGDPCPTCPDGVAVHQAVIPLVDDGGDVVLPSYYALCCDCHTEQYIKKYGVERLQPCGCEQVPLALLAKAARLETERKAAEVEASLDEWRASFIRDRAAAKNGTVTEISNPVVRLVE